MEITKDTKDTKGFWMIRGLVDWEMWGAAPRPGREKFSLHPRHVRWTCLQDVAVESNGYAFTHSGLPVALAARSVAVEGLSLRACTLRFLFSVLRGAKCPFPAPPARPMDVPTSTTE